MRLQAVCIGLAAHRQKGLDAIAYAHHMRLCLLRQAYLCQMQEGDLLYAGPKEALPLPSRPLPERIEPRIPSRSLMVAVLCALRVYNTGR